MNEGETLKTLFWRPKYLVIAMRGFRFQDTDDEWFKVKFLVSIIPHVKTMVMIERIEELD